MALSERQNAILNYLKQHKIAKIRTLAKAMYLSDATIRRELTVLNKMGLLERTHGGAVMLDTASEVPIFVRSRQNSQDKKDTANLAKSKLPAFNNVFIDNSSTSLTLTKMLDFQNKTVVTNGLLLAMEIANHKNATIFMPGGNLSQNTNSLVGSHTIQTISTLHFDLMICSCTSLTEAGAFESSLEQAELKRVAIRNSKVKVLLVDKTKIGKSAMYQSAELGVFDAIFTNADDETVENLRKAQKEDSLPINIINKY